MELDVTYRVSGNVSRPNCVLAVAGTEVANNVKNSASSAGSNDGGNKVERIAVGVVSASGEMDVSAMHGQGE